MKSAYLALFFLFITYLNSSGQTPKSKELISNLIITLSSNWKADSLANNNFRLANYDRIKKSQIDNIDTSFLVQYFGKPNTIRKTNHGLSYWYYVYDTKAIKNEIPFECIVLSFEFNHSNKLYFVSDITLDY
jgi:hypothetical protein